MVKILSVGELLEQSYAASLREQQRGPVGSVRHTAAMNAVECQRIIEQRKPDTDCWRFGILQTLDDYTSAQRRGVDARAVFGEAPGPTGSRRVDVAFAALADYVAERDGWEAPGWARRPGMVLDGQDAWFPDVPAMFRGQAVMESPRAFRERGIFITGRSLWRA
ncbi:hypothetical protein [Devriesea agamarum]|uniref:hypothetical protein n=1 Tax=Devriesea agamarum TaxID=472569 RepID=UPI00071D433C|nr:hypothetical protein [Devriesea agamarum]